MKSFLPVVTVIGEAAEMRCNLGNPDYEDTCFYPESGWTLEQAAQRVCEISILVGYSKL